MSKTDSELRAAYVEKYIERSYDKMNSAGVPITEPRKEDTLKFAHTAFDKLIAAHDQALKQKLLAALPEKLPQSPKHDEYTQGIADGQHVTLSDVTQAIERIFGDE